MLAASRKPMTSAVGAHSAQVSAYLIPQPRKMVAARRRADVMVRFPKPTMAPDVLAHILH